MYTVRQQSYMESNYNSREDISNSHIRELALLLDDVQRDICDSRPRNRDELEALYRKVNLIPKYQYFYPHNETPTNICFFPSFFVDSFLADFFRDDFHSIGRHYG